MGAMATYIDRLSVQARDRIIGGQRWCRKITLGLDGSRCLAGHACDAVDFGLMRDEASLPAFAMPQGWYDRSVEQRRGIGDHFDRATARFGMERVVRAIKLRAARLNGSDAQTIEAILSTPSVREGVAR